MSRGQRDVLVIGGPPRVDLLPPEVAAGKKSAAMRRQLGIVVVGVVLICAAGSVAAALNALSSQIALEVERDLTVQLLGQQAEFIEVRTLASAVDGVAAARDVGASTEVNWREYLTAVQALMPAGVVFDSYTVDLGTPVLALQAPTASLEGSRVGTLAFVANTANLPDVQAWLARLHELPGFVDAKPGSITRAADTGIYTFDLIVHIDEGAYSNRFVEGGEDVGADEAETEASTAESTDGG